MSASQPLTFFLHAANRARCARFTRLRAARSKLLAVLARQIAAHASMAAAWRAYRSKKGHAASRTAIVLYIRKIILLLNNG